MCRAVVFTESKLTCIKQVFSFNVLSEYLQNNFFKSLPVVDNRLIVRRFGGNLGSLPGFSKAAIVASF
jgi:hypothetical protein